MEAMSTQTMSLASQVYTARLKVSNSVWRTHGLAARWGAKAFQVDRIIKSAAKPDQNSQLVNVT